MINGLPPKEKTITPPEGGWEPRTYYVVEVAYRPTNPIHRAIFHSGFLNRGEPAGYSEFWSANYEETIPFHRAHYLKVISEIQGLGLNYES